MDLPLWSNLCPLSCAESVVCTLLWYEDYKCLFLKRYIGQVGCLCICICSLHQLPEAWHLSFTVTPLVAQMLPINPTFPYYRWCWNSSRSYPKLSQLPYASGMYIFYQADITCSELELILPEQADGVDEGGHIRCRGWHSKKVHTEWAIKLLVHTRFPHPPYRITSWVAPRFHVEASALGFFL